MLSLLLLLLAALSTDASGAVVSGKTRVLVITSAAGASAASATVVGADYSGPSNRRNIGISTFSDWSHASYSRFFSSFSHFDLSNSPFHFSNFLFVLSNSACIASFSRRMVSFSRCTLSKSALKAATSSSDRGMLLWLVVPAPRRCLSYILLRYSVPEDHRKRLYVPPDSQNVYVAPLARLNTYLTRSFRPPRPRMTSKILYAAFPAHKCVYVAPLARLNTSQTPIPRCQHQARYIVLGCGSFVRGRKRKKG